MRERLNRLFWRGKVNRPQGERRFLAVLVSNKADGGCDERHFVHRHSPFRPRGGAAACRARGAPRRLYATGVKEAVYEAQSSETVACWYLRSNSRALALVMSPRGQPKSLSM
jgi:hypothetical protein